MTLVLLVPCCLSQHLWELELGKTEGGGRGKLAGVGKGLLVEKVPRYALV